jgi:urease accessory protein
MRMLRTRIRTILLTRTVVMDTLTTIEPAERDTNREHDLLRLMAWLSPSFPVGAFSYSHGLEYAVEAGRVSDRAMLLDWTSAILTRGSGRVDGVIFRASYEAVRNQDEALLVWALEHGDAMRVTRELGVEAAGQGRAFLEMVSGPWPSPAFAWLGECAAELDRPVVYPVAVAVAAAAHDIPERSALTAYLHAFGANLLSAGVRLIPLGQSDGLWCTARLEPVVKRAVASAMVTARADIGSGTIMADWSSARHETQYTRLFRS